MFLLLLLLQDSHGRVENSRVVECDHAAVGPLFEVDAGGGAVVEMPSSEVVAYGFHVDSELVGDALRTSAGKFVFYPSEFIECNDHDSEYV